MAAVGCLSAWKWSNTSSWISAGVNENRDVGLNGVRKLQAPAGSTSLLLISDLGRTCHSYREINSSLTLPLVSKCLFFFKSWAAFSEDINLRSSLISSEPCLSAPDEHLVLYLQWLSNFRWAGKLRFLSSKCIPEPLFFLMCLFSPPSPFHFNLQFFRSFSSECKYR